MEYQPKDPQKEAFMLVSLPEQLGMLFDMLRYLRGEVSSIKKEQMDFEKELREVRRRREEREKNHAQDLLSTTEKIAVALSKRFDFWAYLRDRVLPQLLVIVIVALLYLVFGKPTP